MRSLQVWVFGSLAFFASSQHSTRAAPLPATDQGTGDGSLQDGRAPLMLEKRLMGGPVGYGLMGLSFLPMVTGGHGDKGPAPAPTTINPGTLSLKDNLELGSAVNKVRAKAVAAQQQAAQQAEQAELEREAALMPAPEPEPQPAPKPKAKQPAKEPQPQPQPTPAKEHHAHPPPAKEPEGEHPRHPATTEPEKEHPKHPATTETEWERWHHNRAPAKEPVEQKPTPTPAVNPIPTSNPHKTSPEPERRDIAADHQPLERRANAPVKEEKRSTSPTSSLERRLMGGTAGLVIGGVTMAPMVVDGLKGLAHAGSHGSGGAGVGAVMPNTDPNFIKAQLAGVKKATEKKKAALKQLEYNNKVAEINAFNADSDFKQKVQENGELVRMNRGRVAVPDWYGKLDMSNAGAHIKLPPPP